jgi:NADPH:quinone reductase and related Zn-dependent oxidoreductases
MAKRWIAEDFGGVDALRLIEADVPPPGAGEVTIGVRASGMNPADVKHLAATRHPDRSVLPLPIGYEVAGILTAVGPDTAIASGGGAVGDEVLAFRIRGGYASEVTVPAADVFAKPAALDFAQAANLLLAGTTAAEMLHLTGVGGGDAILVHGASGAVGVSVLQQARVLGVRVIGTASERNFGIVRRYGGEPVVYGEGLADRIRRVLPAGPVAALDCVGTDEAVDVSLALVADRARIVTIANPRRAQAEGFLAIAGQLPASAAFRDGARSRLIALAAEGRLEVPVARTFALEDAPEALRLLMSGHPGGKLALV